MSKKIKIRPVEVDGVVIYPPTITNAVIDPVTKKTLDKLIPTFGTYDDHLDSESVNAVQNKVVTNEFNSVNSDVDTVKDDIVDIKDDIVELSDEEIRMICI